MIVETLTKMGRNIPVGENLAWSLEVRQAATAQQTRSFIEESFTPIAVVADLALPTTFKVMRLIADTTIDDGYKMAAALIGGLTYDAATYLALYKINKRLPQTSGFALRGAVTITAGLALRAVPHFAINMVHKLNTQQGVKIK